MIFEFTNFLYLGRGYNFPAALEGALKLKEISLYPRRRLSSSRNETWSYCFDRRKYANLIIAPKKDIMIKL